MLRPSPEQVDATYLNRMQQRFEEVLREAQCDVSFFREEIEALTTQEALPQPYQEAYGQSAATCPRRRSPANYRAAQCRRASAD